MGRWGLRQMATLCVLVWVLAACGPMLPALPLKTPTAPEPTLIVRTPSSSPGAATQSVAVQSAPASATREASQPGPDPRRHIPTASPTPFYYTVVEGDTLAVIAERFGLPLEALRAANGNPPPDIAYPGQILLIPLEMSVLQTGTYVRFLPTHTPQPLSLVPPQCYTTPAAETICLGYITNPNAIPVSGLVVEVILHDTEGAILARRMVTPAQQVVFPGQRTGYAVLFPQVAEVASAEVFVLAANDAGEIHPVQPLTAAPPTFTVDSGLIRVQSTLHNPGNTSVEQVSVLVMLFDAQNRLTGLRVERPAITLAPNERTALDLLITPLAAGTIRVELIAEAIAPPTTEQPAPVDTRIP